MQLRGRIDRMDRNEKTGQWAVFDYKTGDSASDPEAFHRQNGQWKDLQLPLYLHLIRVMDSDVLEHEIGDDVWLGYIRLPRDITQTGATFAKWTAEDLDTADVTAVQVASDVYHRRFWPPKTLPSREMTEFSAICQENALQKNFGVGNMEVQS